MTLFESLENRKISTAEFTRLVQITNRQTMHMYMHHLNFQPSEGLLKIQEVTNRDVTCEDITNTFIKAKSDRIPWPRNRKTKHRRREMKRVHPIKFGSIVSPANAGTTALRLRACGIAACP
jgi:hypothetical protein